MAACSGTPTDQQDQENPDTSFLPEISGEYLGEALPGQTFQRFGAGIIPNELMHSVTVSPDGREIYWAERRGIKFTKRIGDGWTIPQFVSFSGQSSVDWYDEAPVVSPDNTKLFFNSMRPGAPGSYQFQWKFWVSRRTPSGWASPQPLPGVINLTGGSHWQVSVALSGTIYFVVHSLTEGEGIFFAREVDGEYQAPEPLSVVNDFGDVILPFVAPDESYIIFNKMVDSGDDSEGHFISFRSDGEWGSPQELVGFPESAGVFVTRDGRFVFSMAYWASAQAIEDLRPAGAF